MIYPPLSGTYEAIMDRVREKIFWIVVILLSVFLGVAPFVDTTTPDSPTNNLHPWIQLFESGVCSGYKLNSYGEKIATNCHRL
jgi:hypothetical protein